MVKLAENAGFGFDKIDNNWYKYNHTHPEYDVAFDSVVLKLQIKKDHPKTSEKTSEKIIKLIDENDQITIAELSVALGISTRSVERNIEKLKKQKVLARIGSDKGGHWEIITDN